MRRNTLLLALAAAVLALLAYAWIDGGREPVRLMIEPVMVPAPGAGR